MPFPRFLADILRHRMRFFPVVLVVGPRQSGKTTLAKKLGEELGVIYSSFG